MRFFSKGMTVEAAFETKFKLQAKDYPGVLNFLSASLIRQYKIENSGDSANMNIASLRSKLSFLDKAIKEVLSKLKNSDGKKIIEFVDKDTDFNKMVNSIVRKYLNFYEEEEDVYDIVVSAFTDVFMENGKKAFKDFDGTVVDGSREYEVSIEPYIHTLIKRAVIKHSKKFSDQHNRRRHVTPFDEENEEDAFEREINDHVNRLPTTDKQLYEQLVTQLKKEFKRDSNPDRVEKIFDLLVMGYKKSEIAREVGVSNTRVSDYVWLIKESVEKLADKLNIQGDSTLLDQLEKNFRKK